MNFDDHKLQNALQSIRNNILQNSQNTVDLSLLLAEVIQEIMKINLKLEGVNNEK